MQSNGGVMTAARARARPVQLIESGPAAGVIGAAAMARRLGLANVISLDMGGTTTKASVVEEYEIRRSSEFEVGGPISRGSRLNKGGGYLLRTPAIDIAEVGAGGGSIVMVDDAGALHVGPNSAGAVPGPVCYDNGGTAATLTDANVTLGYLSQDRLPSGLRLDAVKARSAIAAQIAAPLGLSSEEAAYGAFLVGCWEWLFLPLKRPSQRRGRAAELGGNATFPVCLEFDARLESSHSRPEAATPDTTRISALPLAGLRAEEYPRS